jgi:hypothetical protein
MIRMSMGEDDRFRPYPADPLKPVCATVDHHRMAAIGNLQRGVHTVQPALDADFAARSQEFQFHARPAFLERPQSAHLVTGSQRAVNLADKAAAWRG